MPAFRLKHLTHKSLRLPVVMLRVKFLLDQNIAEINPEVQGEAAFDFPMLNSKHQSQPRSGI